jgi:prepilin-type processing-associated H-X9-DG protein
LGYDPQTDGTDNTGCIIGVRHARATTGPRPHPVTSTVIKGQGVNFAGITDGLSNTMLIGEKAVNKLTYQSGQDKTWGDDQGYAEGLAWDNIRYGTLTDACGAPNNPVQDQQSPPACGGPTSPAWPNWHWGSAHPGGFNVALADGSVRLVSYTISLQVQFDLCNRMDGLVFNLN